MEINQHIIITCILYGAFLLLFIGGAIRKKSLTLIRYGIIVILITIVASTLFGHDISKIFYLVDLSGSSRGMVLGYAMVLSGITGMVAFYVKKIIYK